jgi:hypothetical protein
MEIWKSRVQRGYGTSRLICHTEIYSYFLTVAL